MDKSVADVFWGRFGMLIPRELLELFENTSLKSGYSVDFEIPGGGLLCVWPYYDFLDDRCYDVKNRLFAFGHDGDRGTVWLDLNSDDLQILLDEGDGPKAVGLSLKELVGRGGAS